MPASPAKIVNCSSMGQNPILAGAERRKGGGRLRGIAPPSKIAVAAFMGISAAAIFDTAILPCHAVEQASGVVAGFTGCLADLRRNPDPIVFAPWC